MTSIDELGQQPQVRWAVRISEHETWAQRLQYLVATIEAAVAIDIRIQGAFLVNGGWMDTCCFVSIYRPNNKSISAETKERLRLSAISMSSEQSQPATTGDSVWLGIEPYATLYTHGERLHFVFEVDNEMVPKSSVETLATDLGLAILRNAHLVECLRVHVTTETPFPKTFFSLDAWKEAFPSLRSAYLGCDCRSLGKFDLSPYVLKHVRGLEVFGTVKPAVLSHIESMIRNKDYGIEEVKFDSLLLQHAGLLDDTLRRVRSFRVDNTSEDDLRFLAESLERTKAHGDNLVRLRVDNNDLLDRPMWSVAVERILRSRPNLQILNLGTVSLSTFVVLCPVLASSVLKTLKLGVGVETEVEDKTLADGVEMLLQHPTIRDLDLTVECSHKLRKSSQMEGDSVYHFERCVAEGLRATSLRRFHLTVEGKRVEKASVAALTKMYENAWENWSLMDIRLEGDHWLPWAGTWGTRTWGTPSHPHPFFLSGFDFISLRNQCLSRVLMLDENTVPPGLWPLILEWCQLGKEEEGYSESVLFYVLTLWPYLVMGKVESSIDADAAKSVDGPSPKRTRINRGT